MADSTDRTNDVAIWNENRTDSVSVSSSRLDTNAYIYHILAPAFVVNAEDIAIGNNKSMLSFLNTGSKVVRIREIKIINGRTTATTGIVAKFDLFRMTGATVGTTLTPLAFDTTDSVTSTAVKTGATIAGEASASLMHWEWSSDEWSSGTQDVESTDHAFQSLIAAYKWDTASGLKAITIRPGEGIHLKHTVNSTAGSFDIYVQFTEEDS